VKGCDTDGINISYTNDLYDLDLYSEGNDGISIAFYDSGNAVYHPHAYNNYGPAGIYVSEYSKDCRLMHPHLDTNQRHGVIVKGQRNVLISPLAFNNGQESAGSYDGIHLEDATDCIVIGGVSTDFQATKTQRYGICEGGYSDYNIITNNNVRGNLTGGISTVGANTITANNIE